MSTQKIDLAKLSKKTLLTSIKGNTKIKGSYGNTKGFPIAGNYTFSHPEDSTDINLIEVVTSIVETIGSVTAQVPLFGDGSLTNPLRLFLSLDAGNSLSIGTDNGLYLNVPPDANGLYSGNGSIPSATTATLTDSLGFEDSSNNIIFGINNNSELFSYYKNGNIFLELLPESNSTLNLKSSDTTSILSISDNGIYNSFEFNGFIGLNTVPINGEVLKLERVNIGDAIINIPSYTGNPANGATFYVDEGGVAIGRNNPAAPLDIRGFTSRTSALVFRIVDGHPTSSNNILTITDGGDFSINDRANQANVGSESITMYTTNFRINGSKSPSLPSGIAIMNIDPYLDGTYGSRGNFSFGTELATVNEFIKIKATPSHPSLRNGDFKIIKYVDDWNAASSSPSSSIKKTGIHFNLDLGVINTDPTRAGLSTAAFFNVENSDYNIGIHVDNGQIIFGLAEQTTSFLESTSPFVDSKLHIFDNAEFTNLVWINDATSDLLIVDNLGNIKLNTTDVGTSGEHVFVQGIGVAPTTSPADVIQLYADNHGVDGTATLHFRTEEGDIIKLYKETALTAENASVVDATYGTEEADVINNLRTRIGELEAILQNYGLI